MNELANCIKCNKIFNKLGKENNCHSCRKEEEILLKEISRFIRRKKERIESMDVILSNFEVSKEQLLKWIREKRLHETNLHINSYNCKMCNKELDYEGLCQNCSKELKSDLNMLNSRIEIDSSNLNNHYHSNINK